MALGDSFVTIEVWHSFPGAAEEEMHRRLLLIAVNMFFASLPNEFVAWEGEAPAEPLHRWLGRSVALTGVKGPGIAKMLKR